MITILVIKVFFCCFGSKECSCLWKIAQNTCIIQQNHNREVEFKMQNDFVENFKVKDGLGSTTSVEKAGVGLKLIAFNNTPIPMTVEGFERKNLSVVFTVINTTQEGFSRVPYENVNGKTKASLLHCRPRLQNNIVTVK
jgi:hypothetical protein